MDAQVRGYKFYILNNCIRSYFFAINSHASAFSASIIALTPLYMSWTRSFSERPSLLLLEISKMPVSDSECSPWMPRIWT